jgi:hypothetical protein
MHFGDGDVLPTNTTFFPSASIDRLITNLTSMSDLTCLLAKGKCNYVGMADPMEREILQQRSWFQGQMGRECFSGLFDYSF